MVWKPCDQADCNSLQKSSLEMQEFFHWTIRREMVGYCQRSCKSSVSHNIWGHRSQVFPFKYCLPDTKKHQHDIVHWTIKSFLCVQFCFAEGGRILLLRTAATMKLLSISMLLFQSHPSQQDLFPVTQNFLFVLLMSSRMVVTR